MKSIVRGSLWWAAGLVGAAGCAELYGIEERNLVPGAGEAGSLPGGAGGIGTELSGAGGGLSGLAGRPMGAAGATAGQGGSAPGASAAGAAGEQGGTSSAGSASAGGVAGRSAQAGAGGVAGLAGRGADDSGGAAGLGDSGAAGKAGDRGFAGAGAGGEAGGAGAGGMGGGASPGGAGGSAGSAGAAHCESGNDCFPLGYCVDEYCCNEPCELDCYQCNLPGKEGICTQLDFTSDPDNCNSCGAACSTDNLAERGCEEGECTGTCESGWEDCNSDLRGDGCETATVVDELNCGDCDNVCHYRVCRSGVCVTADGTHISGFAGPGATRVNFNDNMLCGTEITISQPGQLVALAAYTRGAGVHVRLGLYRSSADNGIQELIAQTEELTSVQEGATEGVVGPIDVEPGDYWFFFIADNTLPVATDTNSVLWWCQPSAATDRHTYGPFPDPVPQSLEEATLGRGHVYVRTVLAE